MRFAKYLVIVSLGFLALFFIVLYTMYKNVEEQTIKNLNNEQLIYAKQAASGIEDYIDDTFNTLSFLSSDSHIINLDNEGEQTLRNYQKLFSDDIKGVTRVNAQGRIIYTYPDTAAMDTDISYQEHVSYSLKTHKPSLSDVFTAVQGFRTIAVHAPVFKNNKYDGTVAFLLSFDVIAQRYIKNIKVLRNGYAWVVSEKGTELSSPFPEHIGKNVFELYKDYPDIISMLHKMLKREKGITSYHYNLNNNGNNVLENAVYYPVPLRNTFWSVVVATPEADIVETLSGIRLKLLLVTFSLLVIFVIVVYFITRYKIVIEEQKKLEEVSEALQVSEEKYRDLIEKMLDGVYKSTHKGKFLQVNDALVKMLGYKNKEELYAIDIKSELYFQESDRESAALEEKLEEMAIFRLRKKDGSEVWVEDHGRHVLDEKGNVLYHEGVMRDVTERLKIDQELIQAKEKAEEMNRLKTNFLSNMSHELRTPLIGILGYTEIIMSEIENEEHARMMNIINSSSRRLLDTLNQVLNLSKIEAEKFDLKLSDCNINEVLKSTYQLLLVIAREKELQLELDLPDKQIFVKGDETLFTSIFDNLISNAIKFTDRGKISIKAAQNGDNAVIEISDTGIGISEIDQKIIFEEFRQASEGFSRKYEGTGLGLTIARKYTEIMKGKISLKSTPGFGTTFILEFPLIKNIKGKNS